MSVPGQRACQALQALDDAFFAALPVPRRQTLGEQRRRLPVASLLQSDLSQAIDRRRDVPLVVQLARQGQALLVQGQGLIEVALPVEHVGQIMQRARYAHGVAIGAVEGQALAQVGRAGRRIALRT